MVTLANKLESDDDMVAVKAACAILDRAGFGVHASLTVNNDDKRKDLEQMSDEQLAERAADVARQLRENKERHLLEGEVISGSTTTH